MRRRRLRAEFEKTYGCVSSMYVKKKKKKKKTITSDHARRVAIDFTSSNDHSFYWEHLFPDDRLWLTAKELYMRTMYLRVY